MSDDLSRIRVGVGLDVHRLVHGRRCVLAGIQIESPVGPEAHSDGDVVLHALIDALLGASGQDDIGARFPPSDERYRGADSRSLVRIVWDELTAAGWGLINADCSIVSELPKVGPHRVAMQRSMAELLGVSQSRIGIKATTPEKLGSLGQGEGIVAQVAVLLIAPASK